MIVYSTKGHMPFDSKGKEKGKRGRNEKNNGRNHRVGNLYSRVGDCTNMDVGGGAVDDYIW